VAGIVYLNDFMSPLRQAIDVIDILKHPKFAEMNFYDIAILKLATDFSYNPVVQAATFPPAGYIPLGSSMVSGWGATKPNGPVSNILMKTVLEIESEEDCKDTFGDDYDGSFLCAHSVFSHEDSCQGDSGGPLVCGTSKMLCGLVSAGKGCGEDIAAVYTSVSFFVPWIRANMK